MTLRKPKKLRVELFCEEQRPEFEPRFAGAEAAKLKKFSDAGGSQIQWLSDASQGSPKNASFFGEWRSQKPIFEFTSVYSYRPRKILTRSS